MKYHVLAGDALADDFEKTEIDGETIICRECLIEGDINSANLDDFWKARAKFIETAHGAGDYREKTIAEFQKLLNLPAGAEVNLWFEYDLFCQANMWFCLSLLQNKRAKIYRVAPTVRNKTEIWKGFGNLEKADLKKCFAARQKFSPEDLSLGAELWKAFRENDFDVLKRLGETKSECYPKLEEVCRAAIEKARRPQKTIRALIDEGITDFDEMFSRFSEIEGVYGYGDSQVERLVRGS